jgi:hypothetical protein
LLDLEVIERSQGMNHVHLWEHRHREPRTLASILCIIRKLGVARHLGVGGLVRWL